MDAATLIVGAVLLVLGLAGGIALGFVLARSSRRVPPEVAATLAPASEALARVEAQLREVERDRVDAYAGLREQLTALHRASSELGSHAGALAGALTSPTVRGRWGEIQLQRVVELAGMVQHCDFDTQVGVQGQDGGARPDMVVRLAGGRNIPVDAKAPMAAWLQACQTHPQDAAGNARRTALLGQHARAMRGHVDALAGKAYWRLFHPAPEFVVMFLPGEALLDAALSVDPGLAEYAFDRRVVIATPATLIALLRTVAFTWRQERLSASAEQIHALGRELYRRLATFGEHLGKVGAGLERAVNSYNSAVRSLDSRVLVSARRFADLGVTGDALATPEQVRSAVTTALPAADPADVPPSDPVTSRAAATVEG
ncbi:MAG TPA: DNA recombination protein RmuC [Nakamurella sp.]|nr:DNA recombination protein RmuC [Nakamurella sp.]